MPVRHELGISVTMCMFTDLKIDYLKLYYKMRGEKTQKRG